MRMTLVSAAALLLVAGPQAGCARPHDAAAQRRDRAMPASLALNNDRRMDAAILRAPCPRGPDAAIDDAVQSTLDAVGHDEPQALLKQIGPDGIDINGVVSGDGLTKQFAAHTGRFCDLYACGGRTGDLHHLFHPGPVDKQVDVKNGRAMIFVNANTNDELDLSYVWSGCAWWLTAIATP